MKGLQAEFERFRQTVLGNASAEEVHGAELIFMTGAVAASARILGALDADISLKRKCALLRRVSRECFVFQQSTLNPPAEDQ